MYFASFLLVVLLGSDKATCVAYENDVETVSNDWDILIFTQRWPITVCQEWKEKSEKNKCALPSLKNIWTVHGIWPTKFGTEGPLFCNKTWHFDPAQISPIEEQLNIYWLNVEKNTARRSFWKHEWVKHGTCAALLPELNNEAKYFKQGLDWIYKYDMQSILTKAKILPNKTQGYTAEQIYMAVKSVLNKNPAVECVSDHKAGISLINEIRICFNKSLELVDCDGIRDPNIHVEGTKIITSCSLSKPVIYPSVVPERPMADEIYKYDTPWLLNTYRFLQFLIWFTR